MKFAYCLYLFTCSIFASVDSFDIIEKFMSRKNLKLEEFEQQLLKLTNEIVEKNFNQFNCFTYITEGIKSKLVFNEFIVDIDIVDDIKLDEILIETHEKDCENYVIRVKPQNKEKMINIIVDSYKKSANSYNQQRYLYLPYNEYDNNVDLLNMVDMFYTPSLILITPSEIDSHFIFNIVTHNYFNGYRYDVLGIKYDTIDSWTFQKGFHRNADLYSDKIKNLYGKELILATIHYPMFTLILSENNKTVYDGLETRIAAMYVEMHNGTWDVIDHPVHLWGTVFENGSGNGILGSVITGKADMGYAAIYQWHCDVLTCSYPYVYAEVTCMVPRPDLVPKWMSVIFPFKKYSWTALIIFYFVSSCFVFFMSVLLQRIEGKKKETAFLKELFFDAYFNSLRLQLQQVPRIAHTNDPIAAFLKYLTLYYFFVANCWIGGIASVLTVPRYEDPINTLEDLLARSPPMQWGGTSIDWILSIEQTSELSLRRIVEEFVVGKEEDLKKRITTKDFGFFMERLPNGHFGMEDFITEESLKYLKIMADFIYVGHVVTVLPKGSPYVESFDAMVLRMFETGLMQKLEVQVSLERINDRFQNLIRSSNDKPEREVARLNIMHLEAPLIIFVGGMILSLVVFLAEIYINKYQIFILEKKLKELRWANYR